MKNLILSAVIFAVFALTACQTQFGLVYDVNITGDGDGQFEVIFPQGSYSMDGKADLALILGDSIAFNETATLKQEVLDRNKKKELKALNAVNEAMAEQFDAHSESGTYDILIQGTVKELGTGLSFSVYKRLTNRDTANVTEVLATDEYPFVK